MKITVPIFCFHINLSTLVHYLSYINFIKEKNLQIDTVCDTRREIIYFRKNIYIYIHNFKFRKYIFFKYLTTDSKQ